jgi:hypothetical protein
MLRRRGPVLLLFSPEPIPALAHDQGALDLRPASPTAHDTSGHRVLERERIAEHAHVQRGRWANRATIETAWPGTPRGRLRAIAPGARSGR